MSEHNSVQVISDKKRSIDNYFKGIANLAFLNKFMFNSGKFIALSLLVSLLFNVLLVFAIINENPLIIKVDPSSGFATKLDYEVVDAKGEKREVSEIRHFVETVIFYVYTFNKITLKSNLEKAFAYCLDEAVATFEDCIVSERKEYFGANVQGVVRILNGYIDKEKPDLFVVVRFEKRIVDFQNRIKFKGVYTGRFRIKTIPRSLANPNGLVVSEYSESKDFGDNFNKGAMK